MNFDLLFKFEMKLPRHIVKKNGRPIKFNGNKPFLGKTPELLMAENMMILHMRKHCNKILMREPIMVPIWCVFHFYFTEKEFYCKSGPNKGNPKLNLPDLSNLYELPQDCMEKAGVIVNDNQIWSHDLSRRRVGNKTKIVIHIFKFNELFESNITMRDVI